MGWKGLFATVRIFSYAFLLYEFGLRSSLLGLGLRSLPGLDLRPWSKWMVLVKDHPTLKLGFDIELLE